jgi:hypothetical protein
MKLFLLIIIVILIGVIISLFTEKQRQIINVARPMWWAPTGRIPPSPPVRWGYRQLCRKRLNC